MPSHPSTPSCPGHPTDPVPHGTAEPAEPAAPANTGYRDLLRSREFAGLYAGFTLTASAGTLSAFALGSLVNRQTGSPFLTAVSMYGATFATVVGALTLMSVADGERPRRTLLLLQFPRCWASPPRRSPACRRPPGSVCC
ncbi:hypothetical protein [Streptomyces sp. NPDC054849]